MESVKVMDHYFYVVVWDAYLNLYIVSQKYGVNFLSQLY